MALSDCCRKTAEETREACALYVRTGTDTSERYADTIRATPLDATPLADRIKELEVHYDIAHERFPKMVARAEKAETRVKELEAELAHLRGPRTGNDWVRIYDERKAAEAERDAAQKLADVYLDALNVEKVAHLATMQRLSAKPKECEHGNDEELCERCLLPSPETP